MKKPTYKKITKETQKSLATWTAECAERVLLFFEDAFPNDDQPRTSTNPVVEAPLIFVT